MNRKILNLLFISFISVCIVVGFLGRVAIAAEEPSRSGQAYEERWVNTPYGTQYIGRQYTSQYDLMRGEIYPEITFSQTTPNIMGMYNPMSMFMPSESGSRGSAIGGLFTGPSMVLPTSPMSYYMGTVGAPRYETYQSQGALSGSMNYSSIYPGFGLQGSGFMLAPFLSGYGGGIAGGYGGGYGGYGGIGGGFGGFGFPGGFW